jgi:hypothetical protein
MEKKVPPKSCTPRELGICVESPKFPQYALNSSRIESFKEWPEYLPVSIKDLTEAGLVYTGVSDSVRCYHCGGGLRNWEAGDIPIEEHAKWYPNCPHVILTQGNEYIIRVGKGESHHSIMLNINTYGDNSYMETIAVKALLELGYDVNRIRSAAKLFIGQNKHTKFTALELALLYDTVKLDQADNNIYTEDIEDIEDIETLKEENKKLKEPFLCKICMENIADIAYLPCGHLSCCPLCSAALEKCPICRKKSTGKIKIFLAVVQ